MKIYTYDRGVYGASVVVAPSREEALGILKFNQVRDYEDITVDDLEEHPVDQSALVLDNLGDA